MTPILLDISSLERALARLDEAIAARKEDPDNELYVDATIQRFEFTYELAHKMLRRYLSLAAANPQDVEEMNFADLVRLGASQGLLAGTWPDWRDYRTARGTSSHVYDERKARQVLAQIPKFVSECAHLLRQLRARTARPEASNGQ